MTATFFSQSSATLDKYAPLAVLGFDNRSPEEQAIAIERPLLVKGGPEEELMDRKIEDAHGNPFAPDKDLIKRNSAYRRLAEMEQLAPSFSPHYQSRLTHTTHTAEIAEKLCRRMHLGDKSTFLARAMAHAHDIGHPPFSHEGEEVFNEFLSQYGERFDHDDFGFHMLTELMISGYSERGLALTNATLEGIAKRYKRYSDNTGADHYNRPYDESPPYARELDKCEGHPLKLEKWSCIEGQIAATSDWIAGTVSDVRDMLNFYLTQTPEQFQEKCTELLSSFPIAQTIWINFQNRAQKLKHDAPSYTGHPNRLIDMFTGALESHLVNDVLEQTLSNYEEASENITCAEKVRDLDKLMATFSSDTIRNLNSFHGFMKKEIYPKLLDEHVDTKEAMRKFFNMVAAGFLDRVETFWSFHSNDPVLIKIDEGWKKAHHGTVFYDATENEKMAARVKLIITYIICNFTERDILYYIGRAHPSILKTSKDAAYPPLIAQPPASYTERVPKPGSTENGNTERKR